MADMHAPFAADRCRDDRQITARLPGDEGVWFFIIADMSAFALFFLLFSAGRIGQPELYEQSRELLSPGLGLLNTLILITSGMFMAMAVGAARRGDHAATMRGLWLTIIVGMGFAVVKFVEYSAKLAHGITIQTNEFFTYYFAFTGIHFLHFCIGIGVLLVTLSKLKNAAMNDGDVRWVESVGCYWHMVDLLWIMLFPMLYLMRAS